MWFTHLGWSTPVTAIFWDYERNSFSHFNRKGFFDGLICFTRANEVAYASVPFRKSTMLPKDMTDIHHKHDGVFKDKWVEIDETVIQSCITVLKTHPQVNHVILISTPARFLELIETLAESHLAVSFICQQCNVSQEVLNEVHQVYTADFVAENSLDWWLYR